MVGDIGGHFPVLEAILEILGIDENGKLPADRTVIQVEDLVRADPNFRASNTRIMRTMKEILVANGPEQWVQLAGNHECAALGGPAKSDWNVKDSFDAECIAILDKLWQDRRILLAYPFANTLVTHAGMTRSSWRHMGMPRDPQTAAMRLNSRLGEDMTTMSVPGSLVTGEPNPLADCMWAEVNYELLKPWILFEDMPFDQVHGHASPFHWSAMDWWRETPEAVKSNTTVLPDLRRSVTTVPHTGARLTSVDWTLEKEAPASLWPLFTLEDAEGPRSWAENQNLWKGPGLLFSVSKETDGRAYTRIGGPRGRIATWEHRWPTPGPVFGPSVTSLDSGNQELVAEFRESELVETFSFELDLSWNDAAEFEAAMRMADSLLPRRLFELVRNAPQPDVDSVNENREIRMEHFVPELDPKIIDIPINTLPSTRRRSRRLVLGTRTVSIIFLKNGIISLWGPNVQQSWDPTNVFWPHNAVPSRRKDYLFKIIDGPVAPERRQTALIEDVATHELYFNASWTAELEHWQDSAFQWLTESMTEGDVDELRADLGLLSRFLTATRWTHRSFMRRPQETDLAGNYCASSTVLRQSAGEIERSLSDMRHSLNESFGTLSTISQRLQEDGAARGRAASERLNRLIVLFTTVLFVPTVVSGVYGANIKSLADGARGSLAEVLVLMGGSALFSFGALAVLQHRTAVGSVGIFSGIGTIALFELLLHVFGIELSPAKSVLLLLGPAILLAAINWKAGRSDL